MDTLGYIEKYLSDIGAIADAMDRGAIAKAVDILAVTKEKNGRLFVLGVGGGASGSSHAVSDFRKIVGLESYAPTDNVSELTARVNDEGWDSVFVNWLKVSKLNKDDCVLVLSVGGGNREKNISTNLVCALEFVKEVGSKVIGVVGRDGGYTASVAGDAAIIIPTVSADAVTPYTESFQAVIWHLLVSHPRLKSFEMKWESVKKIK
jgi:D-sedoheptulose 7-phosphate isomerase